jgi:LysM repeat protein
LQKDDFAKTYNTTTEQIMSINKLSSDIIYVGQVLLVPVSQQVTQVTPPAATVPTASTVTTPVVQAPAAVTSWPSITYIVKAGDSVSLVAKNFGIPMTDLLKYNYMTLNDWLNAGQKIAINGYAPRNYTVFPSSAPRRNTGTIVDWFLEGQYILRRNDVVQITDTRTGKNFAAKIMGGYNHMDIEPLTSTDTAIMKSIFTTWKWDPRPVAIYKKGMNIAASLSGMPHSFVTVSGNGVSGHFDLYLKNSKPHSGETSQTYVQQHYNNIPIAAGQ